MKKAIACVLFFIIFSGLSGTALAYNNEALILVDEQYDAGLQLPSQITLAYLLGHFDLSYELKTVDAYASGDIDSHRVTFYLGNTWNNDLPDDFLDDVMTAENRVVWIDYNLWKLGWGDYQQQFEQRFGLRYHLTVNTDDQDKVNFNGYEFAWLQDDFAEVEILDGGNAEALATLTHNNETYPYVVRSGNFFFVAGDPMMWISEDSQYLVFCELLHEMVGIEHAQEHKALVRIEDVDPTEDPDRIRAIADYLSSEDVPFSLAVIPRFEDPLGAWGPPMSLSLADSPELVDALQYAVSKGGTIVMHGYTHQYSNVANPYNGVTGLDSEFYIQEMDSYGNIWNVSPVPEDSIAWAQGRIDDGIDTFAAAGFTRPQIWVTPHYLASQLDYQVFSDNFGFLYQRLTDVLFPYPLNGSVYDAGVIPENLGYIEPGYIDSQTIIERAGKNLAIRDGFASFFFHSEKDIADLMAAVAGIKALGYTFTDVGDLTASGTLDMTAPVIENIKPDEAVYSGATTITADFFDYGSGVDTAAVEVNLDESPLDTCVLSETGAACYVNGLTNGTHQLGITVADGAGNSSQEDRLFEVVICSGERPALHLFLGSLYWSSYDDYKQGILSVDYNIENVDAGESIYVSFIGSKNSNEVLTISQPEGQIFMISGGSSVQTVKYLVPQGVTRFRSTIYATAMDACGKTFDFPGPYPGS